MRPARKVPSSLHLLAARQEGLVSKAQCAAHGVERRWLSRLATQGRWIRVTAGVYDIDPTPVVARDKDDVFDHRRRRSAWLGVLAYAPSAVAVGQAALALHGIQGLPPVVRPEVMLAGGRSRRPRAGVAVRQLDPKTPVVTAAAAPAVPVLEALAQAVPTLGRNRAVAVLDNAVQQGRIRRRDVERAHDLARGKPGAERTHGWWQLPDGRAESPLETFARSDCRDAGVPPDDLQHDVLAGSGRFLGRGCSRWTGHRCMRRRKRCSPTGSGRTGSSPRAACCSNAPPGVSCEFRRRSGRGCATC